MINVHFGATRPNSEDITFHEWKTINEAYNFVSSRNVEYGSPVYLIAQGGDPREEIYVTENLQKGLKWLFAGDCSEDKFFQVYETWEGAYKVALSMKEGIKNCYDRKT